MSLVVNTNVAYINGQRNLAKTQKGLGNALSQLSSGLRINRAGDDAAGLAISENLKAQIRSYNQAERNANDGLSLLQTAESGMGEIANMLSRMRELAMQSATDTVGDTERAYIEQEYDALTTEINRVANATEFNGESLLNGSGGTAGAFTFQIGIRNVAANDRITVNLTDMTAVATALSGATLSSNTGAQSALATIDAQIQAVSAARADIGAADNRLQTVVSQIAVSRENLSAANSRIRDADIAQASADLTRGNILSQAGVSVLAQANQLPQLALNLLG